MKRPSNENPQVLKTETKEVSVDVIPASGKVKTTQPAPIELTVHQNTVDASTQTPRSIPHSDLHRAATKNQQAQDVGAKMISLSDSHQDASGNQDVPKMSSSTVSTQGQQPDKKSAVPQSSRGGKALSSAPKASARKCSGDQSGPSSNQKLPAGGTRKPGQTTATEMINSKSSHPHEPERKEFLAPIPLHSPFSVPMPGTNARGSKPESYGSLIKQLDGRNRDRRTLKDGQNTIANCESKSHPRANDNDRSEAVEMDKQANVAGTTAISAKDTENRDESRRSGQRSTSRLDYSKEPPQATPLPSTHHQPSRKTSSYPQHAVTAHLELC